MTIDVAGMLEAGARRIETMGWIGERVERGAVSPTCASVAMTVLFPDATLAQWALVDYLGGPRFCLPTIFDWNDAPGQTKENVIATMRACAAIWRAKHEERQSEAVAELSTTEDSHAQVATTV